MQFDAKIGARQIRRGFAGPFEQTNPLPLKIFIQPCIEKILRLIETIKIKVIKV